jgi:hypothetical protein
MENETNNKVNCIAALCHSTQGAIITCRKEKGRIQQTGNDFKKVMYSIQTGPDAMSAPGRTCIKYKHNQITPSQ